MLRLLVLLALASILGGSAAAVADLELLGAGLILLGCGLVAAAATLGSRTARATAPSDPGG